MNNNNRGNTTNNNNNNNNRRRSRNNRPGPGGGQQLNRVDSRARGNAPQLLEKYRKLAQDAHQNGDRVQAEYYLQFADHYFRVLADARVRQDEVRKPRDERWQEGGEDEGEGSDFSADPDFPSFEQPVYQRREREEAPRREDSARRDENAERPPRREQPRDQNRDSGNDRPRREYGNDSPARSPAPERAAPEEAKVEPAPRPAAEVYEPSDNPFVRDNRGTRGLRPRRDDRRPERRPERSANTAQTDAPAGLDPSLLPPAIAATRAEVRVDNDDQPAAEAPKPKRRVARRKPGSDAPGGAGEALETAD